jgi:hypothetical protein
MAVCLTKRDIARKVLQGLDREMISYRDAAKIFDTRTAYFCHLKDEKRFMRIPGKVWAKFRKYCESGKNMSEFKIN